MSQEITLTGGLIVLNASTGTPDGDNFTFTGLKVNQTGKKFVRMRIVLSTTPQNLHKGSIGTIGYVCMRNLDPAIEIQYGSDGTLFNLRLKPGEPAGPFRWNAAQISVKSVSGTPELAYMIVED